MNYLAISGILVCVGSFYCGFLAFLKIPRREINYTWGLHALFVSFWAFGLFKAFSTYDPIYALFWSRFLNTVALFIPVFFFHFTISFTQRTRKYRLWLILVYFIGLVYFALANLYPNNFISSVSPKMGFPLYPDAGTIYLFFPIFFASLFLQGIWFLSLDWKTATGFKKNQIKYIFLGIALEFLGGFTTFPLVFGIKIFPIGTLFVIGYVITVTYAIVKYSLMDIRIAIARASIFVSVYTIVLVIPFWVGYSFQLWLQALILMLILATSGPVIYRYLQRRVEEFVFKEETQHVESLINASKAIGQIRKELPMLLRKINEICHQAVEPQAVAIYTLPDKGEEHFLQTSIALQDKVFPEKIDMATVLKEKELRYLARIRELSLPGINFEVLFIPYVLLNKLYGFSLLGPKRNGKIYTAKEKEAFSAIASQASLAIENCLFWKDEYTHEQIRRQKSLDNIVSSMSHEIKNPLGCVMGDLANLQEAVERDFEEKIPQDVKDYFYNITEQCGKNIARVVKMIDSIREFSGKTQGEMSVLSMEEVVKSFLPMFQPSLYYAPSQKQEMGVSFTASVEPGIMVKGNKIYLEEVLMNLGNNAIHAVSRNYLKGEDKHVSLKVYVNTKNTFIIEFRDNGYGIKPSMLEDIFLDYVTTKASTEGTGMGLARVRKIISLHGGKIWAESEGEGKGAVFFIELPLAK